MTEQEQHVELYKKYRPSRWDELIGQQKTARSLQMAVKKNRLPTTYGFFGPRGTGKTSSALLLAKSVNCLHRDEDGNPCNQCEVCQNIDNDSQVGVSYLSMANNGGVDDIREIALKAHLNLPVKRQVWILDEVHNLSRAAFDALLKPLEEKSMPSLFILCSTEPDRIPQTILSRIQSRRFSLVSEHEMLEYLRKICKEESISLSDESLLDVVKRGRGSVRDTLTELETIIETGDTTVSGTGRLIEAISSKNLSEALKVIAELSNDGYDGRDISEELFIDLRNLLLLASKVDKSVAGTVPVANVNEVARGFGRVSAIIASMTILGDAITSMTIGADPRIHLEIAVVNMIGNLSAH